MALEIIVKEGKIQSKIKEQDTFKGVCPTCSWTTNFYKIYEEPGIVQEIPLEYYACESCASVNEWLDIKKYTSKRII